ncbi:hypothetical protein [Accumulibacter sp.]|uniref:hypothetical protein n=1 Tax=Accumulibacter sp. TaxID=2053492 RepID=UPI0028C43E9A|nr:hypothetical protein [Accumulibacter sp.]
MRQRTEPPADSAYFEAAVPAGRNVFHVIGFHQTIEWSSHEILIGFHRRFNGLSRKRV